GGLAPHPLGKFGEIDHHPLVGADSDFLAPVPRPDRELDPAPIDPGHLGLARDAPTRRGRRQVSDVDMRAERALAGAENWLDGVQRRVLHDHDHDRCGQHRRQCRVLEAVGEMVRGDEKIEGALGSEWYRLHGIAFAYRWANGSHYNAPEPFGVTSGR